MDTFLKRNEDIQSESGLLTDNTQYTEIHIEILANKNSEDCLPSQIKDTKKKSKGGKLKSSKHIKNNDEYHDNSENQIDLNIEKELKEAIAMKNKGSYACYECDEVFPTFPEISSHLSQHSGANPHICESCGAVFINKIQLKSHERKKDYFSQEMPYDCDICNAGFTTQFLLDFHKEGHTMPNLIQCSKCNTGFSTGTSFFKHTVSCSRQKITGKRYVREKDWLWKKASKKKGAGCDLFCNTCLEIFYSPSDLFLHMISHGKEIFICMNCGLGFDNMADEMRQKHIKEHEQKSLKYMCDVCDKYFASPKLLLMHKKLHCGIFYYECHVCHERFEEGHLLFEHLEDPKVRCKLQQMETDHTSTKQNSTNNMNSTNNEIEYNVAVICKIDDNSKFSCIQKSKGFHGNTSESLRYENLKERAVSNTEDRQHIFDIGSHTSCVSFGVNHKSLTREKQKEIYKCEPCGRQFKTYYKLYYHLNKHGFIHIIICNTCGIGTETHKQHDANRIKHFEDHDRELTYECSQCGVCFLHADMLCRHIDVVHEGRSLLYCEGCDVEFEEKRLFIEHYESHEGKISYLYGKSVKEQESKQDILKCCYCPKVFNNKYRLKTHVQREHQLVCQTCQESFETLAAIRSHVKCHPAEFKYKCGFCGNCYTDIAGLIHHLNIHKIKEKGLHMCRICNQGFFHETNFKLHKKTHTCRNCGTIIKSDKVLSAHKKFCARKMTPGLKHFCTYCGRCFTGNRKYMDHFRVHTTRGKFCCKTCPKTNFFKEATLVKHVSKQCHLKRLKMFENDTKRKVKVETNSCNQQTERLSAKVETDSCNQQTERLSDSDILLSDEEMTHGNECPKEISEDDLITSKRSIFEEHDLKFTLSACDHETANERCNNTNELQSNENVVSLPQITTEIGDCQYETGSCSIEQISKEKNLEQVKLTSKTLANLRTYNQLVATAKINNVVVDCYSVIKLLNQTKDIQDKLQQRIITTESHDHKNDLHQGERNINDHKSALDKGKYIIVGHKSDSNIEKISSRKKQCDIEQCGESRSKLIRAPANTYDISFSNEKSPKKFDQFNDQEMSPQNIQMTTKYTSTAHVGCNGISSSGRKIRRPADMSEMTSSSGQKLKRGNTHVENFSENNKKLSEGNISSILEEINPVVSIARCSDNTSIQNSPEGNDKPFSKFCPTEQQLKKVSIVSTSFVEGNRNVGQRMETADKEENKLISLELSEKNSDIVVGQSKEIYTEDKKEKKRSSNELSRQKSDDSVTDQISRNVNVCQKRKRAINLQSDLKKTLLGKKAKMDSNVTDLTRSTRKSSRRKTISAKLKMAEFGDACAEDGTVLWHQVIKYAGKIRPNYLDNSLPEPEKHDFELPAMAEEAVESMPQHQTLYVDAEVKLKNVEESAKSEDEEESGRRVYQCSHCDVTFENYRHLYLHITSHHIGDRCFICFTCGLGVGCIQDHLTRVESQHNSTHTDNQFPYSCHGKNFKYKELLQQHIKHDHVNQSLFNCDICDKNFSSIGYFVSHYKICFRKKFRFDKEGDTQNNKESTSSNISDSKQIPDLLLQLFNVNELRSFGFNIDEPNSGPTDGLFSCEVCKGSFNDFTALFAHLKDHPGCRPIICLPCGKGINGSEFKIYRWEKEHSRRHEGSPDNLPFSCSTCNSRFAKLEFLVWHNRRHQGKGLFVCKVCGKDFPFGGSFVKHVERSRVCNKYFRCLGHSFANSNLVESCSNKSVSNMNNGNMKTVTTKNKTTSTENLYSFLGVKLTRNERKFLQRKNFLNLKCKFDKARQLLGPARMKKTAINGVKCFLCSRFFSFGMYMCEHGRSFTYHNASVCNDCGRIFRKKQLLLHHKQRKHSKHLCSMCNSEFWGISDLKRHVRDVHKVEHSNSAERDHTYQCSVICEDVKDNNERFAGNVKLTTLDSLKPDIYITKTDNEIICQICGILFTGKQMKMHLMRNHILRKHLGNKTQTCSFCNKSFVFSQDLKSHISTCHGQEQRCKICNRTLKSIRGLRLHMEKNHKESFILEMKFKCVFCGECFGYIKDLRTHKRLYHSDIRYSCKICGRKLADLRGLRKHIEKVHGSEVTENLINVSSDVTKCNSVAVSAINSTQIPVKQREKEANQAAAYIQNYLLQSPVKKSSAANVGHENVPGSIKGTRTDAKTKNDLDASENNTGDDKNKSLNDDITTDEFCICEHCGLLLLSKGSLKAHIKQIHSGNVWTCNICDNAVFTTVRNATTHRKQFHKNICSNFLCFGIPRSNKKKETSNSLPNNLSSGIYTDKNKSLGIADPLFQVHTESKQDTVDKTNLVKENISPIDLDIDDSMTGSLHSLQNISNADKSAHAEYLMDINSENQEKMQLINYSSNASDKKIYTATKLDPCRHNDKNDGASTIHNIVFKRVNEEEKFEMSEKNNGEITEINADSRELADDDGEMTEIYADSEEMADDDGEMTEINADSREMADDDDGEMTEIDATSGEMEDDDGEMTEINADSREMADDDGEMTEINADSREMADDDGEMTEIDATSGEMQDDDGKITKINADLREMSDDDGEMTEKDRDDEDKKMSEMNLDNLEKHLKNNGDVIEISLVFNGNKAMSLDVNRQKPKIEKNTSDSKEIVKRNVDNKETKKMSSVDGKPMTKTSAEKNKEETEIITSDNGKMKETKVMSDMLRQFSSIGGKDFTQNEIDTAASLLKLDLPVRPTPVKKNSVDQAKLECNEIIYNTAGGHSVVEHGENEFVVETTANKNSAGHIVVKNCENEFVVKTTANKNSAGHSVVKNGDNELIVKTTVNNTTEAQVENEILVDMETINAENDLQKHMNDRTDHEEKTILITSKDVVRSKLKSAQYKVHHSIEVPSKLEKPYQTMINMPDDKDEVQNIVVDLPTDVKSVDLTVANMDTDDNDVYLLFYI